MLYSMKDIIIINGKYFDNKYVFVKVLIRNLIIYYDYFKRTSSALG